MISSRLSSLLVRDGVLGVKRMEQAFQRQVIYGGGLDTILLEMNAVPEERLWHYLSLATGLPAADRDLLEYFDPRAVQVCPREIAEKYHVAPCALDGPALRCLVIDPVDLGELEGLATALGVPVQPFVVPEFRFHAHLERLFGIPTPSRYALLARRNSYVPSAARHAEPTVVVDDEDSDSGETNLPHDTQVMAAVSFDQSGPAVPGSRRTIEITTDALAQQMAFEEQKRRTALSEVGAPTPMPTAPVVAPEPVLRAEPVDGIDMSRQARSVRGTIPIPAGRGELGVEHAPDKIIADPELLSPSAPRPATDSGPQSPWRGAALEPTPLEPREAAQKLAQAGDRDAIFGLLVRAARARARYAGLLTVQGATAFGRIAIEGDALDPDIGQVAIPLAAAAALRGAYDSGAPYIGPVITHLPEIDDMLARMGGVVPPSALVMPVVIRDRTVAMVYAHRGADTLSIAEVADVLPVAGDAAMALSKLIVRAKSQQGFRRPATDDGGHAMVPPAAIPEQLAQTLPAPPSQKNDGAWGRPQPRSTPAPPIDFSNLGGGAVAAPAVAARPPEPIGVIVDAIEHEQEPAASRASEEALARLDDLVPELQRRFPGKINTDRYATSGRALRAAQHGPLLGLCIRAGARVVPMLVEKLGSADREVRYYATICLAEVRAPIAVPGLVGRLFDSDYGVRGAALEALLGYPPRDVDAALQPVRLALRSDALRARAAAYALGELRDTKSILDLIDATERDPGTATEAHRALVLITKQDYGTKAKKWRKWWEEHRDRSRIEWMLEALAHSDERIRQSASEELKRLTGEYFGYHHDGPRREREEARQRWMRWWEDVGKKRFVRAGS
jgi:Type II secretion system (T2SS), protein E, N-terminal domain